MIFSALTSSKLIRSLWVSFASLSLTLNSLAQNSPVEVSQDIIIKNIGGMPLCLCTVKYKDMQIKGHFIYDVSLIDPIQIHESSINIFDLNAQTAKGKKVNVEFKNGFKIKNIPLESDKYSLLVDHTKIFASKLKEVPVIGFIGPKAFSNNVLELDVAKGLLRIMGIASDDARKTEIPYSLMSCGLVVDGKGPGGSALRVNLSNIIQDSLIAPYILREAKKNKTIPNTLIVGQEVTNKNPINWANRSAIRFEDTDNTWPISVNAIIGADALSKAIVTIWPKRNKISVRPSTASKTPPNEQKYFFALANKNTDQIKKFISSTPRRRLLDDACLRLLDIHTNNTESSTEQIKDALNIIAKHFRPERCSEQLLDIADNLETIQLKNRNALIQHTLNLAIRESTKAVQQTTVHEVHLRIGRRAFSSGDLKIARRHLLSAAFGMPHEAECNFWLGEYYKETGKLRRAWSRYFQVLLDDSIEPDDPTRIEALNRINTLNSNPEFRKTFNMVEAEEYMAGRLEAAEFHAESRYRFMKKNYPNHVHMVELFIDPTNPDSGGMELAFQAIDEFFKGKVMLAAYHIKGPLATKAAAKRLAFYSKKVAPLIAIDGKPMFDTFLGEGERPAEDAALHYPEIRNATIQKENIESTDWKLTGNLKNNNDNISLEISASEGKNANDLNLTVLLCEKSVMNINANGVFFHHFVVRDALTPAEGIDLAKIINQPFKTQIDLKKIVNSIEKNRVTTPNNLIKPSKPFIDPQSVFAIAIIQRKSDSRILSASKFSFSK